VIELVRIAQLLDAFEDREQAAQAEEHQRDDERPEVPAVRVPERMLVVRGFARLLGAEHQQPLIAGVGRGVDRFREQRCRAGEQEHEELAQRDPEVREERGDDRALRPFLARHGR
jgi:hypothetical protein